MTLLSPMMLSGTLVLPLIEGGKGIAVSDGRSAGAWAAAGGVGTFSGVYAKAREATKGFFDKYRKAKTREERAEDLLAGTIEAGIEQAQIAHETASGKGRLHLNVLWELAFGEKIVEGILEGAKGLIHGVTCGAGMPYRLAEISAKAGAYYYPIVSSSRAFKILWKRSYERFAEWLGGVVYEDPWIAGGHNGISNKEDPRKPEDPYPRVFELRKLMREFGLGHVPIVMAGGVWWLSEWANWIDNPDLGPIAFQLGTRPLLTQESPISDAWKAQLTALPPEEVSLHQFSPTGFYASSIRNAFLRELEGRSERQVSYTKEPSDGFENPIPYGTRGRSFYVSQEDSERVAAWALEGHDTPMITPSETLIFVSSERAEAIRKDQTDCKGCLSQCRFSNFATNAEGTTGLKPDPRSFCIFNTLADIADGGSIDTNLRFSGKIVHRFTSDPFYANGFVPTVAQLIERLQTGF